MRVISVALCHCNFCRAQVFVLNRVYKLVVISVRFVFRDIIGKKSRKFV